MIDPRLQALRVLAERGTVTATAEALHLTPSTVSQQLKQLSAKLGVALLEHDGRRVRLTPAARALLVHADTMFTVWERAEADLAAHRAGTAGELRVTGIATAITALIAPAARRLRERLPAVSVTIGENPSDDRYELLLTRRADIAVVIPAPGAPAADDARFTQSPLLEEPQDLLVPATHPLAGRRDGADLADARDETWIRAGDPSDQHRLLLTACAAAGFAPRLRHEAVDWPAVAALVAYGFGICLIPRLAPVPGDLPVLRVPLHGTAAPRRRIVTCVRRGSENQPLIAEALTELRRAAATFRA